MGRSGSVELCRLTPQTDLRPSLKSKSVELTRLIAILPTGQVDFIQHYFLVYQLAE